MSASFTTSATIGALAAALAAAQAAMEMPAKDRTVTVTSARTGSRYTFSYATLGAVMAAAKPVSEHGIAVVQAPVDGAVITRLMCGEEWVECVTPIKAAAADAQSYGSAVTYARRYAIAGLLAIVADEDDDGAAASGDAVHSSEQRQSRPRVEKRSARATEAVSPLPDSERDAVGQAGASTAGPSGTGDSIVQTNAADEAPYVIYGLDGRHDCGSGPAWLSSWQKILAGICERHVAAPEDGLRALTSAQTLNATAIERIRGIDQPLADEVLALMHIAEQQLSQQAAAPAGGGM